MRPGRHVGRARRRAPADAAGFARAGLAVVFSAASFLLHSTAGGETVPAGSEWQLVLAFALLAAGLLWVMHGMRQLRGARPPALVVRVAHAVVPWNAGGPERLLPLVLLLLWPLLEAWFDFI